MEPISPSAPFRTWPKADRILFIKIALFLGIVAFGALPIAWIALIPIRVGIVMLGHSATQLANLSMPDFGEVVSGLLWIACGAGILKLCYNAVGINRPDF